MTDNRPDVLAIGDVVTDAFIKLLDDQATTYADENGNKILAMPYGMKIPFHHAEVIEAVGNAANAAVSFAKLGLHAGLVSNVGSDAWGRDIIHALQERKVDTRFVHINQHKVSNYHYILWYKDERTILIKHEEYDYNWPRFRKSDIPKWVYFSSISKNALDYHDEVVEWLNDNPDVKLAFQPGTFQIEAGTERLKELYQRTEVVVLNREEAVIVTGGNYDDLHDLMNRMHSYGPKIVVITDGPDGAYASDGENRFKMPNYPDPAPPVERTGAGDSFASALVAALAKGATLEAALLWAPINSMNVVQHVGAQEGLLTVDEIEYYMRNAPEWYHPERF
ncbi:carbohydrate kinase family protein [bacterium]|nr:carbohydrate kinase family protein [bacterium]NBX98457.1 carbohydrate kinase family protein [bacterium]NDC94101.1 carbohydrate kinase family protein [bacterium]NDD83358.1 carbohydrate kinase family protein [bacterium]NDG28936.1 carbohydrate kinase family protein [bacterium]